MRVTNFTMVASLLALAAASCAENEATDPIAEDTPAAEVVGAAAVELASEGAPYWIVSDEDSTMVLFPTIHILPDGLEWRSDEMNEALANAEGVWFEVLPTELNDQALMQSLLPEFGLSPERPLSSRLDEETYAEFSAAAEDLGIPPAQLDAMRPWLAAVTLSVVDLQRDGFNPAAGVEMVLAAEVPDDKERALETVREQFGFFGGLSEEVEVAFLKSSLEEIGRGQEQLKLFADAWAAGDLSTLEEFVIDSIRDISDELYQALLVQRNENWVEILDRELQGSGTDFVAVGAGHLVGEAGVPTLLRAKGYSVIGPLSD